ncbi:MAG: ribosome silencing factor [Pyrinomonadaceae bacterium]|jgi:ribosome-associated protein
MEELQNISLTHNQTRSVTPAEPTPFSQIDSELQLAIRCAAEKKAERIVALDLKSIVSFTDYFAIVSGANPRQVQAIADEITEQLKKQFGRSPIRIEGYSSAEWILLDFGDFIFHVFDREARDFFDLERLWRDAAKVELPEDL